MIPTRHISALPQCLFGLVLICWPLLDTDPANAITPRRIALGSCLVLLLVSSIALRRRPIHGQPTDWAMLACALWYTGRAVWSDTPLDPYDLLNSFILLCSYAWCRLEGTRIVLPALFLSGVIQSIVALAQCAGTTASRHSYYDLTGSFPNPGPLGGWLCIATLAALILSQRAWQTRNLLQIVPLSLGSLILAGTLLLTDSRAAWLGVVAGAFVWIGTRRFRHRPLLLISMGLALLLGTTFLYHYKKESADGRLFIWHVSAEWIAERPIAGHGIGSFQDQYMFAQADYFARHPASYGRQIADQVDRPFNEWIGIACEQGAIGTLLTLLLFGLMYRANRGSTVLVLLTGLIIFGLFSYPSAFLSFGMVLGALLAGCPTGGPNDSCRRLSPGISGAVCAIILATGGTVLGTVYRNGSTERSRYIRLREASLEIQKPQIDIPRLETLASRLPIAEFYVDLGDRLLDRQEIERAKHYYRQAMQMIPSRLRPYDGLFRAYLSAGQTDSATRIARHIVAMPLKVSNTTTIRIRHQAKEWLERQPRLIPEN